uniref:Uncharacterized protein n=1 Tax=Firmicutes phage HS10 TaxID=3056392 RepID=A0AA49X2J7_9VIRU|nr:MAG: hypothetical protein [Firmicutes phage HS10]
MSRPIGLLFSFGCTPSGKGAAKLTRLVRQGE